MKSVLSHVALLVPNSSKASEYLRSLDFKIGPAEKFDGEGTLEIYIGDLETQTASLLLMEPTKEGAYTRAMAKRGPSLHHIAIDVLDLEAYIDHLAGSGWLLHPKSLKMLKHSQTAYLARPGIPALIEVQQRETLDDSPHFITGIAIPGLSFQGVEMFGRIGLHQIQASAEQDLTLTAEGKTILFKNLLY